ncbi:hypothetical protein VNO77_44225 [Canavalia gladiata]|uniref:Uncharacterized protein n=1 Tax=Canavalia gladiata TaxID=3824 RepID=A0AAN9JWB1_CANGL
MPRNSTINWGEKEEFVRRILQRSKEEDTLVQLEDGILKNKSETHRRHPFSARFTGRNKSKELKNDLQSLVRSWSRSTRHSIVICAHVKRGDSCGSHATPGS